MLFAKRVAGDKLDEEVDGTSNPLVRTQKGPRFYPRAFLVLDRILKYYLCECVWLAIV